MQNLVDFSGKPFHFIGIGGIGMSALAYVIAKRHLPVSGSDIRSSVITQRLQTAGAHIFLGQNATNLDFFHPTADSNSELLPIATIGVSHSQQVANGSLKPSAGLVTAAPAALPQVICSTAINTGNPEYLAALEKGCPIFHRSDLLAALIKNYRSIAVAGTHGKTTTSSLIGYMLLEAGIDPTIVVGGEVNAWEGNARLGAGSYLVAEADESDGSLAKLSAEIGVITNIEMDHPDHYASLEEVINTFQIFVNQCQTTVGCIDCEVVQSKIKPTISYSLNPETGADYTVDCVSFGADGTLATVWERGQILGKMKLKLLGKHNLSNALAAVAVGRKLGLDFDVIAQAIASFEGAKRRFELRGHYNGITFVDDYAHHPSEIQVTLAAARLQVKSPQRIVAIFQPHRYSRTLTFLQEFAQSFTDADLVIISDIYSAGEPDNGEINGQKMADLIANYNSQVYYQPSLASISKFLTENLKTGDFAIFLGAGNLNQIIPEVMQFYQNTGKTIP